MGKFLLGVLIGVVFTVLGLLIIALALGRLFANKPPTIASNSALVLALSGDIPEAEPVEINLPLVQRRANPTVRDLWTALRAAASDKEIKAVVLQPSALTGGYAKLQEIRQELLDFKRSGKPVYAFLHNPGVHEYYLATAADKIFVSPNDLVNVKGLHAQVLYFKNGLDKLGINFQVDHIGQFKDAGDEYTRTNMSPQTREVLNSVVDQIYQDFSNVVAVGRRMTPAQVQSLIDQGPFSANQAKSVGLVDVVGYEDELYSDLKRRANAGDLVKTDIRKYVQAKPGSGDRIALIVGEGEILPGDPENTSPSEGRITFAPMQKMVESVKADSSIKGVILRVDSPGGDAVTSDEILHTIKLLSSGDNPKPLVVSFSDVAASGGYYMSMTGDPVVAYPDTITGSIGVLYARPNVQGLLGKIGVSADSVSRGKNSDIDDLTQPLNSDEQAKLHEEILETYQTFLSRVAAARRRPAGEIEPLAQGRVWMGTQAKTSNLVDELGGLNRAVELVRRKAKLSLNGDTNLVVYPPKRSLWEVLAHANDDNAEAVIDHKLKALLPGVPVDSMRRGGILEIAPYEVQVR